jgi:hypothetical protein
MPLNEPRNQAPLVTPSTAEPPTTPAQHRENRRNEAEATAMAEAIARGLNESVLKGEMPNG